MPTPFARPALIALLALLVTACGGYRFPGDQADALDARLHGAVLRVTGQEAGDRPLLARQLQQQLAQRLGLATRGEGNTLEVRLLAVERLTLLEDRSGRADKYQVTITALPVLLVDGTESTPAYAPARGSATYYESRAGAEGSAARLRAEQEALQQLLESLGNQLAGGF